MHFGLKIINPVELINKSSRIIFAEQELNNSNLGKKKDSILKHKQFHIIWILCYEEKKMKEMSEHRIELY